MDTLGFIGVGHMASAILDTLLGKKLLPSKNILIFDPDQSRVAPYTARGVKAATSNRALAEQSVLVILAVKPQTIPEVLDEIRPVSAQGRFISIAAGISLSFIRERLEEGALVARVMPNAPLMVNAGATVIAQDDALPPEMKRIIETLFSYFGTVTYLPEDKLNEVIGLSGSSPAFFFRAAHIMAQTAQEQGIDYDVALPLIAQAMYGSAKMLTRAGQTPERLISMVASPAGTTEAALVSLDHDGFDAALRGALLRCTERAYELGREP